MNDKEKEMIINMGALGYPVSLCARVVGVKDEKQFQKDFVDPKSEVYQLYQQGKDRAQYLIDLKLFEMAQSGDIKAMRKLEIRKRKVAAG